MNDETPFLTMRQSLIDRGYLDSEFRFTEAGSAYSLEIMARVEARSPKNPKVAEWVKASPIETSKDQAKMRSMADPAYAYQPHTDERRQRQSESQRARLGIPEGHRRVYGVDVPEAVAEVLRPLATEIAGKRGREAATAFMTNAQANGWRHDPALVPVKQKNVWTPERRKKASEGAAAMHARHRAARAEAANVKPIRTEETVNVQAKVAAPVRDDRVREIHGVSCIDGDNKKKRVIASEHDAYVGIETVYEQLYLTAAQARYLGDQLYGLAIRIDRRAGSAA